MSWFSNHRVARFLAAASIYALAWWLVVGAVMSYRPSRPNPDQFTIVSLHADYLVDAVDRGTVMQVTETIVVEVPTGQEFHGFERVLPTTKRGRSTPVTTVHAWVDGDPAPVQVKKSPTRVRSAIGTTTNAAGRHTIVLTYFYEGVVSGPELDQEFSWDVNGTDWPQAIGSVSATITFADYLYKSGSCGCLVSGSDLPCRTGRSDHDGGVTFAVDSVSVAPHQSLTVTVSGLQWRRPGPPLATSSRVWLALAWLIVGGIAVTAAANLIRSAWRRRTDERPWRLNFAPRDDLPPIVVASLVESPRRGLVAELLRAASQGHVVLAGGAEDPLTAELTSWPHRWRNTSQRALRVVFGSEEPGTTVDVAKTIAGVPAAEVRHLGDIAADAGLVAADQRSDRLRRSMRALLVSGVLLIPAIIISGRALNLPAWWVTLPIVVLVVSLSLYDRWLRRPRERTARGQAAMRYLVGVKQFLTGYESNRARAVGDAGGTFSGTARIRILSELLPTAVAMGERLAWQEAAGSDLEAELDWLPPGGVATHRWGLDRVTAWSGGGR